MRIQHNIMAMNAYRNYTNNTSALSKNLEKLSSGYKINRAGDDAAGLAISEKMRAQITGLQQAQSNAKSGINLVQTAEGALQEVHDMLNRMVKLADQSANGTYDDNVDRANLQKEVSALSSEIDRIADSANFNGIELLNGTQSKGTVTFTNGGASAAAKLEIDLTGLTGEDVIGGSITVGGYTFNFVGGATANGKEVIDGTAIKINKDTDATNLASAVNAALTAALGTGNKITTTGKVNGAPKAEQIEWTAAAANGKITLTAGENGEIRDIDQPQLSLNAGLSLQIGDTSESFNKIRVGISDMHTAALGISGVNVSTQDGAATAVDKIRAAINKVSATRGDLGATQNRLDHTINNLSVMTENIQDAEATIRDTDVAEEMMAYTKNNILIQSAQAMLAQANQVPQGVLQLLQ